MEILYLGKHLFYFLYSFIAFSLHYIVYFDEEYSFFDNTYSKSIYRTTFSPDICIYFVHLVPQKARGRTSIPPLVVIQPAPLIETPFRAF